MRVRDLFRRKPETPTDPLADLVIRLLDVGEGWVIEADRVAHRCGVSFYPRGWDYMHLKSGALLGYQNQFMTEAQRLSYGATEIEMNDKDKKLIWAAWERMRGDAATQNTEHALKLAKLITERYGESNVVQFEKRA